MWKLDAFLYIKQSQWKKKEKITFFPAHAILHSLSQYLTYFIMNDHNQGLLHHFNGPAAAAAAFAVECVST